jgi:hypothetical protein
MINYDTEISRGSLMPLESRRVARLLLNHPDENAWVKAIKVDNILQKDNPATAIRQANLIRKRLETLEEEGWELISNRENEVANQLLLVAAMKQSRLLFDFMLNVYISSQRRMEDIISAANWENFLIECSHHDITVNDWNESTKLKVFNSIVRLLVETKYLSDKKTMKITPNSLHPVVRKYLEGQNEALIIQSLERLQ